MSGVKVFTPILEEPPEQSGGREASTSSPPPPLPPARPTTTTFINNTPLQQPSYGGFHYFKDVVEAQARGDIEAVSGCSESKS